MAQADFDNVTKRFGGTAASDTAASDTAASDTAAGSTVALDGFTLQVADGELITVLGPSGCGKSTLLRLTAGLETLSAGTIRLDGRRIDAVPPQQRDVAMVFQSYALYPHMTVRGNIEFPLRIRGMRRAERLRQVDDIAALLELGELLDRRPAQLSGGQRQRVALARALVRRPALFLLDEPLSNLDARLRLSVRRYIHAMQRRVGVTTLYVTHDQTEAMTLGDRIVVMQRGRIQQVDTPVALYERPANAFVAGFIGTPPMNLVPAEHADGVLCIGDQRLAVPASVRIALGSASRCVVGIRPEHFVASDAPDAVVAVCDSTSREVLGSETLVRARLGETDVTVRLAGIVRDVPPQVSAPGTALHVFAESGERLG